MFAQFVTAAETAAEVGLGLNAGHDLDLDNLPRFATVPGLLEVAISTFILNSRHMFFGLSLLNRYKATGLKKFYLIFGLTDETYSLITSTRAPDGHHEQDYYLALTALNQSYWVLGCALGAILGVALIPLLVLLDLRSGGTGWGLCAEGFGQCSTSYFSGFELVAGLLAVMLGLVLLAVTFRGFPLTLLTYQLLTLHALILILGGHYTYAEVPLFNYLRDTFDLSRNHWFVNLIKLTGPNQGDERG